MNIVDTRTKKINGREKSLPFYFSLYEKNAIYKRNAPTSIPIIPKIIFAAPPLIIVNMLNPILIIPNIKN